MAAFYDRGDWDAPEITEWRDNWGGDAGYGPETYRCFPFPVLGGIGLGLGFASLGCRPRRFCSPREFGCRPRYYGCRPRHFGCYPPPFGCYPRHFGCYPA